jgi:hypothetical protein
MVVSNEGDGNVEEWCHIPHDNALAVSWDPRQGLP